MYVNLFFVVYLGYVCNIIHVYVFFLFDTLFKIKYSICCILKKVFICDWTTRTEDFERLRHLLQLQLSTSSTVPCVQPFHGLVYPLTLNESLQIAQRYANRIKMNVSLCESNFKFRTKSKSARLKIGYVSSDFGNHPLSHLMQSVFGLHNRQLFDITCYSLTPPDGSQWRNKIEAEVENFVDIGQMHANEAAKLINAQGIHVLINLNGYTKGARNEIFALHPAPIQV